jgi:drug/metabolite transporter (DMT)-like permease
MSMPAVCAIFILGEQLTWSSAIGVGLISLGDVPHQNRLSPRDGGTQLVL